MNDHLISLGGDIFQTKVSHWTDPLYQNLTTSQVV